MLLIIIFVACVFQLIINLVPENLDTPFFPAEHYVRTGISEDVTTGTPVLNGNPLFYCVLLYSNRDLLFDGT